MHEDQSFDYGMRPVQNMRLALIAAIFAALNVTAFLLTSDSGTPIRAFFAIIGIAMAAFALLVMKNIQPSGLRKDALRLDAQHLDVNIRGQKPISASLPYETITKIDKTPMRYGQIMFALRHANGELMLTNTLFDSKDEATRFISLLEQRMSRTPAG